MQTIDLILPCYNEADALPALHEALHKVLPDIAKRHGVTFRLIFIDDGSTDDTIQILRSQSFAFPARIVVLSRNFGKEAALSAGIALAEGDAAIMLDADLQHPPRHINALLEHWRAGNDVVYYYKQDRRNESVLKRILTHQFYKIINLDAPVEIVENAGDFRLLDRRVLEVVRALPERERFLKGIYAWVGFRHHGLPFDAPERAGGGVSRFSSGRLGGLAINGLTSFSVAPIRLMTLIGLGIAALAALYILWIVLRWLFFGAPFSGFASIVVLILFFGGMQSFCLGFIGVYSGDSNT